MKQIFRSVLHVCLLFSPYQIATAAFPTLTTEGDSFLPFHPEVLSKIVDGEIHYILHAPNAPTCYQKNFVLNPDTPSFPAFDLSIVYGLGFRQCGLQTPKGLDIDLGSLLPGEYKVGLST